MTLYTCCLCKTFQIAFKKLTENAFIRYLTVLYTLTFLFILPVILRNVKHSVYYHGPYNETVAQIQHRKENDLRLKEAENFILQHKKLKLLQKNYTYDVIISVITVSRNRHMVDDYKPKYLTQVISKFLMLLEEMENKPGNLSLLRVGVMICNVDNNPASYDEAQILSNFVTVVNRFSKMQFSLVHPLEKEKEDYAFCLNNSYVNFNGRYHFLVEDDALPRDNVFIVLNYMLQMHLDSSYKGGEFHGKGEIMYVKFYHPERLLSYTSQLQALLELCSLTFILSSIVVCISEAFLNINQKRTKLWIVYSLYFLLVLFTIGRVNVNDLRQFLCPYLYSFSPAPSCCTPAILYPNSTAISVINFLQSHQCRIGYGKDNILDQMLKERHEKAYLVQPNTFWHIGMYSGLRSTIVNSYYV